MAIYADDLLLFLNDVGPSPTGALQVLDSFAPITGLKVNWSKSLLFPIDPATREQASPDLLLLWVEHFCYLGVKISRKATDYMTLNLSPVIQEVRQRLNAWEYLPLSLLG